MLVRPSYVLGGRAMVIAYDLKTVEEYVAQAAMLATGGTLRPILIDQFLEDAIEVDVDALADGTDVVIAGNHGAHRGSGNSFRRFFVRDAGGIAIGFGEEPHSRIHGEIGARAERDRRDERAVCDSARRGLRAGSESAGFADDSVCEQGDRSAAGESCGAIDDGTKVAGNEIAAFAFEWRRRN